MDKETEIKLIEVVGRIIELPEYVSMVRVGLLVPDRKWMCLKVDDDS